MWKCIISYISTAYLLKDIFRLLLYELLCDILTISIISYCVSLLSRNRSVNYDFNLPWII
jgi:hypothetical protein